MREPYERDGRIIIEDPYVNEFGSSRPTRTDLPPGVITVMATNGGWLVQIGRTKRTRQWWLSDAEARELCDRLAVVKEPGRISIQNSE